MAGIPPEAQGITAAFLCAIFSTGNLIMSKMMQAWDWPYFFLAGLSALCITLGLSLCMFCQKTFELQRREVKWVFLRGLFGCFNNVLSVCAVLAGAQVGSVGALGSVNTVVAALLGRLVLGEPLGKLHVLAVIFSLAGSILISDPQQALSSMGSSLFGNLLALLAGISIGCMFISSRKSGSASSMMLTTSAMLQRWIVCWCLAFLPVIPDGRFGLLRQNVGRTFLFWLCLAATIFCTNLAASVASKKCPAALSSTLVTGATMTCGYLSDILVFGKYPSTLTIIGAVMMLLAVMTMALTRLPPKTTRTDDPAESTGPTEQRHTSADTGTTVTPSTRRSTSRHGSLASFVASEFAERRLEVEEEELPVPASGPRHRLPSTVLPSVLGAKA